MLNRIREALNEFAGFEEWRTAYQEYYARLDMAPYPYRFYEFEELFSKAHPSEMPRMANAEIPPLEDGEKFKLNLCECRQASRLGTLPDEKTAGLLPGLSGVPSSVHGIRVSRDLSERNGERSLRSVKSQRRMRTYQQRVHLLQAYAHCSSEQRLYLS